MSVKSIIEMIQDLGHYLNAKFVKTLLVYKSYTPDSYNISYIKKSIILGSTYSG